MPPSGRKAAPMATGFSRLMFYSPRARAEFPPRGLGFSPMEFRQAFEPAFFPLPPIGGLAPSLVLVRAARTVRAAPVKSRVRRER